MHRNSLTRLIIFHLPLWILAPLFSAFWIWGGGGGRGEGGVWMTPTYCIIWALLPLASCWVWRMEALAGGQRSGESHAGAFWSRLALALPPPYPLLTTLAGCWPLPGPAPTKLRNSDLSPCSLGMGMGVSITSHYCQSLWAPMFVVGPLTPAKTSVCYPTENAL